jgi:hypothetical protein
LVNKSLSKKQGKTDMAGVLAISFYLMVETLTKKSLELDSPGTIRSIIRAKSLLIWRKKLKRQNEAYGQTLTQWLPGILGR